MRARRTLSRRTGSRERSSALRNSGARGGVSARITRRGSVKRPAFQFYPGDWLRDHISGCSLAAQGLWLRMMIVAHDSDRYGYLEVNGAPMPADAIARRCGCESAEQYSALLSELREAGVPSRTPEGIIYSRRMVRDEKLREIRAIGGKESLKNPKVAQPKVQ